MYFKCILVYINIYCGHSFTHILPEVPVMCHFGCGRSFGSAEVYSVSVEQFWQAASPFPSEDL